MPYQEPDIYIFPESQRYWITKKRIWAFLWGATIFLFIGVGLGQLWRIKQIEPERNAEIQQLRDKIDYFKTYWTPIHPTKLKSITGAGKRGK